MKKKFALLGFTIFGLIGSWIGAALDHGNWFGAASTIIGLIGSVAGIWIGYYFADYFEL